MKIRFLYLLLTCTVFIFNCTQTPDSRSDENLNATLWMQTSVEYAMSARQAYKLAQVNVLEALLDRSWTAATEQKEDYYELPPAIILDVDETVLNNSPFQARLVRQGIDFRTDLWEAWVREARAEPIEGATEFIRFARGMEIRIFYVTNRRLKEPTLKNLKEKLDPRILPDDLLCKNERPEWSSDKSSRRTLIAEQYRILLLIGDDYNDFVTLGKLTAEDRFTASTEHQVHWGREWIILPNPEYGHWENALYDYDYELSDKDKLRKKFSSLRFE